MISWCEEISLKEITEHVCITDIEFLSATSVLHLLFTAAVQSMSAYELLVFDGRNLVNGSRTSTVEVVQ